MTELSPAEEAFYDALDEAREALDGPTFQEISNMTAKLRPVAVPTPTIRGWFKRENLPRNNPTGEDQLFAVAAALRADAGEIDWAESARQARKGRDARLRKVDPQAPEPRREKPPETPKSRDEADAAVNPKPESTAESGPSPVTKFGRSGTRPSIAVPAAIGLTAFTALGVYLVARPPQPSCAKVVAQGASAGVWEEIGAAPLRYKRNGDQVKLYEAMEPVTVDGTVYRAVHLRDEGWAWMRRDDLAEVDCSVQ